MTIKEAASLGGKANAIKSHQKYLEKYLQNPKYCECCGKIIPYERRRYKTCDNDCAKELAKLHNIETYKKQELKGGYICQYCGKICKNANSLIQHEIRCKYNPNHIDVKIQPNLLNCTPWNKGLTKETDERIQKISETYHIKYKQGLIQHSGGKASTPEKEDERKRKISKSMKESGCGGKRHGSGRGKKGWYKGIFCDSSWELAFVIYCLDHNLNIRRCEEKRTYLWNGEEHAYIPDFITDEGVIEIKGYKTEQWIEKHKQNPDVKVLYEDDMKQYIEYAISSYGKDYIKLYE